MTPPLITLEEHWYSQAVWDSFDTTIKPGLEAWPGLMPRLMDAGELRLRDMDKGRVTLQVISHCTADRPSPAVCREGNDTLAESIRRTSESIRRFAGFAVLPMIDPAAAAVELERTVKELGFVGALVDHKVGNAFIDGAEYDVLWDMAQKLDVPIYLHPTWPTPEMIKNSYASSAYSPQKANILGAAMWGWHSEVALTVLRLHAAGVFDRFPRLKIVVGHFGELLPYMLQRINDQESLFDVPPTRRFQQVWTENLWFTTSSVHSLDPMRCMLANTPIDHIMYSIDYPFTTNKQGLVWMQELEKSGLVTPEQVERIAYKNAENLLGIRVPS